jgi:hypothetical protein
MNPSEYRRTERRREEVYAEKVNEMVLAKGSEGFPSVSEVYRNLENIHRYMCTYLYIGQQQSNSHLYVVLATNLRL